MEESKDQPKEIKTEESKDKNTKLDHTDQKLITKIESTSQP